MSLDWYLIWLGLRAFLTTGNPYASYGYFYPPAFTLLTAPLGLLSANVSYALVVLLTVILCLRVYGRRFAYWLTFVPVFYGLFVGNVDLLLVAAAAMLIKPNRKGALIAAMLTLKPQLAVILLPFILGQFLRENRRIALWWAAFVALLWGVPALLFPELTRAWFTGLTSGAFGHGPNTSAGVWSLGLPLTVTMLLCAGVLLTARWRESRFARAALMLVSPVGQWNGLVALMDTAPIWLLSPVSILALYASGQTGSAAWWAVIPLAAFGWQVGKATRIRVRAYREPTMEEMAIRVGILIERAQRRQLAAQGDVDRHRADV